MGASFHPGFCLLETSTSVLFSSGETLDLRDGHVLPQHPIATEIHRPSHISILLRQAGVAGIPNENVKNDRFNPMPRTRFAIILAKGIASCQERFLVLIVDVDY